MLGYWREGDRVAVQSNLFCDHCEFCARGEESLCLNGQLLGIQRDGGFAERVAVPASALVRLPEKVDFKTAAALTLAGSTAMHMLTYRAQVRAGDWVLAIGGTSGVGSAAIQIAKQLGARVISTGSTEAKRHFAAGLGAEHVVDSSRADWLAGNAQNHEKARGGFGGGACGGRSLAAMFHLPGAGRDHCDVRRNEWTGSAADALAVFCEGTKSCWQLRAQSQGQHGDTGLGGGRQNQSGDS